MSFAGKSLSEITLRRLLKLRRLLQKKRTVGALERDEWLRAAWKVTVAGTLDTRSLVFD